MKKSVLYAAAAAVTMSVTVPVPAQAAVKMFVMNGNSLGGISGIGCDNLGVSLPNISLSDILCSDGQVSGGNTSAGNLADTLISNGNKPGVNWPGVSRPDKNCPELNWPSQNQPGQNEPEQNQPEQNGPEQNEPEQNQPEQNKPGQNQPEQDETGTGNYVQQVIDLVNEERAKAGLSPLTEAQNVAEAAGVRAEEISRSFSHTRPDGSSFSSALTQSGVTYRGAGENIAYGQRTPEEVMKSWMNSQGHRANILNADYTTIGVGYYQNSSGTGYWTQLFTY